MSFWSMNRDGDDGAELRIEGEITAEQDIFDWLLGKPDTSAPAIIREVRSVAGPLTVWINSPGGDVVAASAIYTALRDCAQPVTVKIDGAAFSAASVIAMAGSQVLMSPTALMMIHNPLTAAEGDFRDMQRAVRMLREAKDSIVSAYVAKTGLSAEEISRMMNETSFLSADTAIRLGFADGKLFDDAETPPNIENMLKLAYRGGAAHVSNLAEKTLRAALAPDHPRNNNDTNMRAARLRLARARNTGGITWKEN